MTTRDLRRWNNCHDKKQRAWNLPFLLLTAMFVWFSTSTSLAQIDAVFTSTNANCPGSPTGSITCVSITGGQAPYFCEVLNCSCTYNPPNVWNNVPPNLYTVIIRDSATPQNVDTSLVFVLATYPDPLEASVTTVPSSCNASNGSACVQATGGSGVYSFDWRSISQPSQVLSTAACLSNVPAGQYIVNILDPTSGCGNLTLNVSIPQSSLTLTSTVTNTQCAGADCQGNVLCNGSMTLVPVGTAPYAVTWSDGFVGNGLTRTGMCPGTYTATVTDANGCSASVTNTIAITGAQLLPNAMPPGANLTNLNAVAGFATAAASTHFITTNTVWNNNTFGPNVTEITAACNIVVMPGVQLTIQGLNLRMPQGSSIRVLPQSMLGANNSVFEPGCGTTWRGFEVLGNGATASGQRGALELMECTITRATLGICNSQFQNNNAEILPTGTWTNPGGKVRAEKTLFLNNIVDVRLGDIALDAPTGNTGAFVGCTFQLETLPPMCENMLYSWWLPTSGRVQIGRCQYTIFDNCTFVNLNNALFTASQNTGATSMLVGLRSVASCLAITGTASNSALNYESSFTGYRTGISVEGTFALGLPSPTTPCITIENTRFRCWTGISGSSILGEIFISRNWLEDLPMPFSHVPINANPTNRAFITLSNQTVIASRYKIINNVLIDDQNEYISTGCRIHNGGGSNNFIVANYFRGFGASIANPNPIAERCPAIHYWGINRSLGPTGGGGRFECNEFHSNRFDVFIQPTQNSPWSLTGPASIQQATWPNGFLEDPKISAGNSFVNSFTNATNLPDDMRYPSEGVAQPFFVGVNKYYYHPLDLNINGTTELSPAQSDPTQTFFNQCLYSDLPEMEGLQVLSSLSSQWSEHHLNYTALVDDGNTEAIINQIATLATNESWSLFLVLSEKAEVLSDDVLIALVKQANFPTVLLVDLLVAVPGASANERLHEELLVSGRVLSEADWTAIKNALPFITEKNILEEEMAAVKLKYDVTVLQMKREDYGAHMEHLIDPASDYWKLPFESMRACAYLWAQGQQPPAYLLDQVSQEMERIGQTSDWVEYVALQQLRLDMFAREPREFSENERQSLETYFYSDPLGKGYAAYSLLNEFTSFVPDPCVWEVNSNQTRSKQVDKAPEEVKVAFAFPNPCENFAALRHESLEVYNASYCIMNLNGTVVLKGQLKKGNHTHVLDVEELASGVYLIELTLDNPRVTKYQQKLIKQ